MYAFPGLEDYAGCTDVVYPGMDAVASRIAKKVSPNIPANLMATLRAGAVGLRKQVNYTASANTLNALLFTASRRIRPSSIRSEQDPW